MIDEKPKKKRMSGPSPKARTMQLYRLLGYEVDDSERRLPIPPRGAKCPTCGRPRGFVVPVTKDLFGFADLVAINASETIGVQATSAPNLSARAAKIAANEKARKWLAAPTRLIIIASWSAWLCTLTPMRVVNGEVVRAESIKIRMASNGKTFDMGTA